MPTIIFKSTNYEKKIHVDSETMTILDIAQQNDIDIEGACEGSMACSTCHIIVDPKWYDKLEMASWDEEDMLDLAFGLTHTSRLGCQIIINENLEGMKVKIPTGTRNMSVE